MKNHKCLELVSRFCPAKVPEGRRSHIECFPPDSDHSVFKCLNRMDKHPELFRQKIYRQERTENPFNLNKHLNYNSSGIICSETKFVPWTCGGLKSLINAEAFVRNFCISKNEIGRKIAEDDLFISLLKDYGFNGRKYMKEMDKYPFNGKCLKNG